MYTNKNSKNVIYSIIIVIVNNMYLRVCIFKKLPDFVHTARQVRARTKKQNTLCLGKNNRITTGTDTLLSHTSFSVDFAPSISHYYVLIVLGSIF